MLYACMNRYLIDSLVSLKRLNLNVTRNLRELLRHENHFVSPDELRFKAEEHAPPDPT